MIGAGPCSSKRLENQRVLEYLHTASDDRSEWLPRVRKIKRGGQVETIIATGTR